MPCPHRHRLCACALVPCCAVLCAGPFVLGFEENDLTESDVRQLVYQEITQHYHP